MKEGLNQIIHDQAERRRTERHCCLEYRGLQQDLARAQIAERRIDERLGRELAEAYQPLAVGGVD